MRAPLPASSSGWAEDSVAGSRRERSLPQSRQIAAQCTQSNFFRFCEDCRTFLAATTTAGAASFSECGPFVYQTSKSRTSSLV